MRICFDSNVVIDIWGKSDDFLASFSAYDTAVARGFDVCIPMFTTSDIAYILQRDNHSRQKTRQALASLFELFDVFDGHPQDCKNALDSAMPDYEDAMIAFAADRNAVDFIITRNKKDFENSPVPALTPQAFLDLYKPANLNYAMVGFDGQS